MPKTRFCGRAVTLIVMFVLAAIPCLAQTDAATISGRVADPTGAVVPGAVVQLQSAERGTLQETTTNSSGIYVFPAVQPGVYHITVRKDGFHQVDYVGLTANTQAHIEQNFRLQVGSATESLTVRADAVNMNTTDAAVSTVIDHKFVENMPLNGRSFQDLLTLAPGVTLVGNAGNGNQTAQGFGGEITVNGQRTEANYFTVDGVSANVGSHPQDFGYGAGFSGNAPAQTALGTTQAMVSVDALQEFRATTSTYSAEYGRTPGGQFSFTTRSGTNGWHGSAYDYFRNEALDANNWFLDQVGLPKDKERQNDFGGTVGGPVVIPGLYSGKDKTFFFFSYEGLRLWTPQGNQTIAVPDAALRNTAPASLQPVLNAFPLVNNGEDGLNDGFGFYSVGISNPGKIDSISARVDHSFSDKFKVFGRYADTPTILSSYSPPTKSDNMVNYRALTLGINSLISSQQTNELRFNLTQVVSASSTYQTPGGGAVPLDVTSLPGPNGKPFPTFGSALAFCFCFGNFSGATLTDHTKNSQRQYNITDAYTWVKGRHTLKFGADWRRLSTHAETHQLIEFNEFDSEASILANSLDYAAANSASPSPVEPVYLNFSAFAQDEWKASQRLSVSMGVRWDVNPPPGNATGPSPYTVDQTANLATTKVAPAGTPLWHTDWLGFAPRFGVAYQFRQTPGHETVIRAGFGKFFDAGNVRGSDGFNGLGFIRGVVFNGTSFPMTSAQLTVPPPSVAPPYSADIFAFDPHLKMPKTYEWNVAIEQALGSNNAFTLSYVGSAGRGLLGEFWRFPQDFGNPNFVNALYIDKNAAMSDYDALQVQFQRKLSHGIQALISYTWSHSIDDASSNFTLFELLRARSDFDIRNNLQAAVTYDVPGDYSNPALSALLKHWGLDARVSARSALPIDIVGAQQEDPMTRTFRTFHPNLVPDEPLYVHGPQYPGGRALNYNAYQVAPTGVEGNVGRNSASGFPAWQANLALRREFPLGERLHLQFRAEAFNVFNHPNFGDVMNYLPLGPCGPPQPGQSLFCFGVASRTLNSALGGLNTLYQFGGPRSLQIALKLVF